MLGPWRGGELYYLTPFALALTILYFMAVLVTVIAMNTPPATPSSMVRTRGLCYPTSLPAFFGRGELYYLTFQVLCAGRGGG